MKLKAFTEASFDLATISITPSIERKTIMDVCQVTLDCGMILRVLEGYYFKI